MLSNEIEHYLMKFQIKNSNFCRNILLKTTAILNTYIKKIKKKFFHFFLQKKTGFDAIFLNKMKTFIKNRLYYMYRI